MRVTGSMAWMLLAALLGAVSAVHADDEDVVDYRKHIMSSIGEELASINMIIDKKAPADNFLAHVQALAVTATQAKKAFEPKVAGGSSKPAVWANWPDFAKRLDALVASTDALVRTAQEGGPAAVAPKLKSLDCQGCHDAYMVPKK